MGEQLVSKTLSLADRCLSTTISSKGYIEGYVPYRLRILGATLYDYIQLSYRGFNAYHELEDHSYGQEI